MRATASASSAPNGKRKTTLVNLLTGALAPEAGEVRLGANLAMATLDQGRESLDPNWTLSEALTGGRGDTRDDRPGKARHVVQLHEGFSVSCRAAARRRCASSRRRARPP